MRSLVIGLLYLLPLPPLLCAAQQEDAPPPVTLAEIQGWTATGQRHSESSPAREELLRTTALEVATAAALAQRTQEINRTVFERYAESLDHVYRFDPLLLNNGLVCPAVVLEGSELATLQQGAHKRIQRAYRIDTPAKLVTRAPTWRTFLIQNYPFPEKPIDSLLPRTARERLVWRQTALEGWASGLRQADDVAKIRMARLNQTFKGIIRYHLLHALRMITAPRLDRDRRGVDTGANGAELLIGVELYRIAQQSRFRRDGWRALPQLPSFIDAIR
jgi:defect-in-organelle-trafficking protein DotC